MSAIIDFLNRGSKLLLDLDPDGKQKLIALQGKVLCIELTAPPITLYMTPTKEGMEVNTSCTSDADVTLSGSLTAFAQLGIGGVGSGVLSDGEIQMKGDVETGQAFQKILSQLDIDLEELLSQYIGDTPAHKVGNLARGFGEWAKESIELSQENLGDYLKEEKKVLVTDLRMEQFRESLGDLRADVDRLEQRLDRIKQKLKT